MTGCSPNHLDWHGSWAEYVAAKQRMLTGQTPDDFAVLNPFDAEVASWTPLVRGKLNAGVAVQLPPQPNSAQLPPQPNSVQLPPQRNSVQLPPQRNSLFFPNLDALPTLAVPGRHNRINAACAAAAALAAGCGWEQIERALAEFRGLPQRLQRIAAIDGRTFFNDSTATTPESTVAALRSLDPPLWLLAGGKSKGFDFRPLAAEIMHRAGGAALFGAVRDELFSCLLELNPHFPCLAVETMEEALHWCWDRSQPGDSIVLSPGCASTAQFRNFQERGRRFEELVRLLDVGGDSCRCL